MNWVYHIIESLGGAFWMAGCLLTPFLSQRRRKWGATIDELSRPWLADDHVPSPRTGFMHGITINAPSSSVWPWIQQIGQDRGGFYSYTGLENLVGCQMTNADMILPGLPPLAIGTPFRLHPQVAIPISDLDPGHGFAIRAALDTSTGQPIPDGAPLPPSFLKLSWLFFTYDLPGGKSRFISRWRTSFDPGFKNDLMYGNLALLPVAHVMDVRMLRGVKQRIENCR